MKQISITRDDFREALKKAVEKTVDNPDLTDKDPALIFFIGVSGISMCKTIESILFDGGSQDE